MNPEEIQIEQIEVELNYIIVLDSNVSIEDLKKEVTSANDLDCEFERVSNIEILMIIYGKTDIEYHRYFDNDEAEAQIIEEINETLNNLEVNYSRI